MTPAPKTAETHAERLDRGRPWRFIGGHVSQIWTASNAQSLSTIAQFRGQIMDEVGAKDGAMASWFSTPLLCHRQVSP